MEVVRDLVEGVPIPKMAPIRQIFDDTHIEDLDTHLQEAFRAARLSERVKPGETVALGVGSRGLAELPRLVAATVAALREVGAEPFIVPAMGSHGGAIAEGQTKLLAGLGVTEETAGAPIRSSMDVVELDRLPSGLPVLMDREAMGADHIAFINRVKPHTSFSASIESGLAKMLSIGLANHLGAASCHAEGFGRMAENVIEMAKIKLARAPILFGLATVENAYDKIAVAEVVMAEEMLSHEPALLVEARAKMPRLLFDPVDVLIVDLMGKEYSGTGMDPNITGRASSPFVKVTQKTGKLVILSLSKKSGGNATGLGNADFCTRALYDSIDFRGFYANALTSTATASAKIPMIMETSKMAVEAAIRTANAPDPARLRMMRVPNTLHLEYALISEGLLSEATENSSVEVLGPVEELPFDASGNLAPFTAPGAAPYEAA